AVQRNRSRLTRTNRPQSSPYFLSLSPILAAGTSAALAPSTKGETRETHDDDSVHPCRPWFGWRRRRRARHRSSPQFRSERTVGGESADHWNARAHARGSRRRGSLLSRRPRSRCGRSRAVDQDKLARLTVLVRDRLRNLAPQ